MPIGGTVRKKTHDIMIRLPEAKEDLKVQLTQIAKRNSLTVNDLCIIALEKFLAEIKETKKIEITLK